VNEAVDAAEDLTPTVEGERLHISGLLVGFVSGLPQLVFPMVAAIFGVRKADNPVLIPIVIAAVLLFSLFFRWLAWLRFQYFVGEHDIRVEKGILNRTARSIPYERIQDVSIEQKPLARMMGLGEVKFETGGGDGDDAKLSFVTLEEANRLRALIRSRKAGVAVAAPVDAPQHVEEDAHPIFAMDGKRVFVFGLYSFSLVIFAVLGGLAQQFDFLLPFDFWDFKHWIGLAEERGVSVNQPDFHWLCDGRGAHDFARAWFPAGPNRQGVPPSARAVHADGRYHAHAPGAGGTCANGAIPETPWLAQPEICQPRPGQQARGELCRCTLCDTGRSLAHRNSRRNRRARW